VFANPPYWAGLARALYMKKTKTQTGLIRAHEFVIGGRRKQRIGLRWWAFVDPNHEWRFSILL
jgi:hypothetical protein